MKNRFIIGITGFGLSALLFTGCSKLPQAEIDAANVAIEDARVSGAEMYIKDTFILLQDSMASVMKNIESQESKLFKNYNSSIESLTRVTQFAGEVKKQTETKKEELKNEILTTISEVKTLIESSNNLILEAPKGKEGTMALLMIKDELKTIENTINELNTMLESGEYLTTLDKARVTKEKATSINNELQDVITKYKSNVKNRRT